MNAEKFRQVVPGNHYSSLLVFVAPLHRASEIAYTSAVAQFSLWVW
jgi:hypothetical protein